MGLGVNPLDGRHVHRPFVLVFVTAVEPIVTWIRDYVVRLNTFAIYSLDCITNYNIKYNRWYDVGTYY